MTDEIGSPCVRSCVLDPDTDRCVGCGRHIAEITLWADMDAERRSAALREAAEYLDEKRSEAVDGRRRASGDVRT